MGDNQASVGFYCSAPLIRWRICDASPHLGTHGCVNCRTNYRFPWQHIESSLIFRRWTGRRRPFRFIRQKNLNQAAHNSLRILNWMHEFGCWNLISPNERHNYSETTIANSRKTTYYIDPMGGTYALSDSVHPLHIICWTVHRQNDSEDGCPFSWFSSTVKIVFSPATSIELKSSRERVKS